MLRFHSEYKTMGDFSRHVLHTSSDENYILDTGSVPFVVDQIHCQTDDDFYKQNRQYTVQYAGQRLSGTLGYLKESSHKRLLETMNFKKATTRNCDLPVAVCVKDLKKSPESLQTKGLKGTDGIIGLALAGGQQQCVNKKCVSSADVSFLRQMNAYGFEFENGNKETNQKESKTQVKQGSLCGLANIPKECAPNRMYQSDCQTDSSKSTNTIGVVAACDYTLNNIQNNKNIKFIYPSHCTTENGNLLLDTGWPREQDDGKDVFKDIFNVDMIDEGQIQSLEVNYKDKTISYNLV